MKKERRRNTMSGDLFEQTIQNEKKACEPERCFVITPIGSAQDPIRRHIDGIIDGVIKPAFEGKYEVIASHKIAEPGTITKQIIREICCDKLAVVNLTNSNPNVMYELAIRYCVRKAVILIAEEGTNLPSDMLLDRVIFYKNDVRGGQELKDELIKAENQIDFSNVKSPVYGTLQELGIEKNVLANLKVESSEEKTAFQYVLDRLNTIDSRLQIDLMMKTQEKRAKECTRFAYFYETLRHDIEIKKEPLSNATDYVDPIFPEVRVQGFGGIPGYNCNLVYIDVIVKKPVAREAISEKIKESLIAVGYTGLVDCILPPQQSLVDLLSQ